MFRIISFFSKTISATFKKFNKFQISLPKRLRGGLLENSVNYMRNVFNDYKNVYFETLQDIHNHPLKASIIGSILLSSIYCIKHNPTDEDFQMQLIDSNNQLLRVPESIRNKSSCDFVQELFQLNNKQLLRYQSLGFFSVIYRAEYSPENALFRVKCQYLKPSWSTTFNRIVDIGFLDRFRYIDYKMTNYDINEDEWRN